MKNNLFYKDAGVNIDSANKAKKEIKFLAEKTFVPSVLSNIGGFSGLFELKIEKYRNPVIVSSIDGVGTKLKVAFMVNKHSTIGIDLVSHCANDIVVCGAKPLFFLDYLALGKMNSLVVKEIIKGISKACRLIKCSLISGETAEMPGFYKPREYDLAGCIIGIVEKEKIITGKEICPKDIIIGLPSNGLHTNGYSLVRKIFFEKMKFKPDTYIKDLRTTLKDELLKPHFCYSNLILDLLKKYKIKGLVHLTGGGFIENIPRILPLKTKARIKMSNWEILPIFNLLQQKGNIKTEEMFRTFNMGIGMILICSSKIVDKIINFLDRKKIKAKIIGEIAKGNKEVEIY